MKILHIDLELAPNLATVWGLFKQNIGINQLLETSRVMCFAAKWNDAEDIIYKSEFHDSHEEMIKELHKLFSEADAVVTYNGASFDIPVANREFLLYNFNPPAPYKGIDLIQTVRKKFRFVSNKLDHVSKELELGSKLQHEGHTLWLKCMNKDPEAWQTFKDYNIMDVILLEKLYKRILPWIDNHPSHALFDGADRIVCTNCGSDHLHSRGIQHTKTLSYRRFQCTKCGTWMKARTAEKQENRNNILTQVGL